VRKTPERPGQCPARVKLLLCVNNCFHSEPNCFHIDFGMPTPPLNHETSANHANAGDEQVGSITCQASQGSGLVNMSLPEKCFISHSYADAVARERLISSLPDGISPFVFPPIQAKPHEFVSKPLIEAILGCEGSHLLSRRSLGQILLGSVRARLCFAFWQAGFLLRHRNI
jgi:hypothetical protein